VLRDLAATRRQLSDQVATAAGSDTPDERAFASRQREALRVMQMQLHALGGTAQWLLSASQSGECVCEPAHERLASVTDELRRQVEFHCQELSRLQTAWQLEQSRAERQAVDDCEAAVLKQLDWLRARREQLLDAAAHPVLSRLAHTISAERAHCGCPEHSATMRATTPRVVTRRTLQERPSQLRPEETPECRRERRDRAVLAWRQWQEAIDSASALEVRRRVLEEQLRTADVPAVSDLQQELAAAREELARYDSLHRDLGGVNAEIRTLEGQLVAEQASPVIQEASGHLNLLTLGRYCALRVSEAGTRLQVIAENGCPYVASALSRGTLFQVALSLRVALVDEYARRGLEFPLVLDDVLVDSD
jgi:DNA repair exonuclease SbcCD ATPase subunit